MCLACEMDALWYAEWERLAAEGAGAAEAGTAGVPPAVGDDRAGAAAGVENGGTAWPSGDGLKSVNWTPARPVAPRSARFFCEGAE